MAKNGPLEAEMGPKGAKTAQNGPKCPQNDPKPRKKVPLHKATLSPCVWTPNSRVALVGVHTIVKNGQKWAPGGRNGPKGGQQQQATRLDIPGMPMAQGPKLRPKGPLPKALLPTKFGPPTPGWRRSAALLLRKMARTEDMQCGPAASKQVGQN